MNEAEEDGGGTLTPEGIAAARELAAECFGEPPSIDWRAVPERAEARTAMARVYLAVRRASRPGPWWRRRT